jgi:hypothetical protein
MQLRNSNNASAATRNKTKVENKSATDLRHAVVHLKQKIQKEKNSCKKIARPRQRMKTGQWPWPGDTKVCRSYQVLGSWNWKQSAGLDPITLVAGAAMNQPFGSSSSHGRSIRDRWIKPRGGETGWPSNVRPGRAHREFARTVSVCYEKPSLSSRSAGRRLSPAASGAT